MNKNDNTSNYLPSKPFTEEQLMQKPRPSLCVLIRGSRVNTYKLDDELVSKKVHAK